MAQPAARDAAWAAVRAPWWSAALLLLVLNDQVLKSTVPGVATGKLSDVAGLLVAPPLVAIALRPLDRRLAPAWVSVAIVGAGFVAIQVLPVATQASATLFGLVASPRSTPDPTDLLTLPTLLVPLIAMRGRDRDRRRTRPTARSRTSDRVVALVAGLACLATSGPGPEGVIAVSLDDAGHVYAGIGSSYDEEPFTWATSRDGGATWTYDSTGCASSCVVGDLTPCGPAGCLVLDRSSGTIRTPDGEVLFALSDRLRRLEERDDYAGAPAELRAGVVAAGRAYVAVDGAGLLVGDGLTAWRFVPVGDISPATTDWWRWLGPEVAALLATITGLLLVLGGLQARREDRFRPLRFWTAAVACAVVVAGAAGLLLVGGGVGTAFAGVAAIVCALPAVDPPSTADARRVVLPAGVAGAALILLAGAGVLPFLTAAAGPLVTLAVGLGSSELVSVPPAWPRRVRHRTP